MTNVTPIFSGVPIVAANPRATVEQLGAFWPTQDWILVRPHDVFAAAGLQAPQDLKSTPHEGEMLRWGEEAWNYLPDSNETTDELYETGFTRVQWRAQAHHEPVKIGEELLLLIRARDVVAVLQGAR